MKKNLYFILSGLIAATLLFSSCKSLTNVSIEKRQHRGGYYVDWGNGKVKTDQVETKQAHIEKPMVSEKKVPTAVAVSKPTEGDFTTTYSTKSVKSLNKSTVKSSSEKKSIKRNFFEAQNEPLAQRTRDSKENVISNLNYSFDENSEAQSSGSTPAWLLVVLCIFIPPLAIYLHQGVGEAFWIDLILWILGLGVFGVPFFGLLWLAAIIYAFVVVF